MPFTQIEKGKLVHKPCGACLEGCVASHCTSCSKAFGVFRRRHHCRAENHTAHHCPECGGVPKVPMYVDGTVKFYGMLRLVFYEETICRCTEKTSFVCSAICEECSVGRGEDRFCIKCDEERILKGSALEKEIDAGVFSQGFVGGGMTPQTISSGSRRRLQEESGHLQRSHSHHEICVVCDKTTCGGNCLRQLTSVTSCQICRQPVEQCETNGTCQRFMQAGEKCAYCAVVGCSEGCPRVAFQTDDHLEVSDYLQHFAGGGGAAADSHPRQSFQKGQHSARGGL